MPVSPSPPDPSEVQLLREAIRNPFAEVEAVVAPGSTFAIAEWYRLVQEKAPLWSFKNRAFMELRSDSLPTSYPLSRIIDRIEHDEGTHKRKRVHIPRFGKSSLQPRSLSPLEEHLLARRISLASGGDGAISAWQQDGAVHVERHYSRSFRTVSEVDSGASTEDSAYWEIGSTLMAHVEALEAARTKMEREASKLALAAYVDGLGTKLAPFRPEKGPPRPILEALFKQGKWLFDVAWEALPAESSQETRGILSGLGAAPRDANPWSIRLALPMLSVAEIRALRAEVAKPRGRHSHVAPRRFTVFAISHRLGEEPLVLSRKLRPREDAKEFFEKPENRSPIRG